MEATIASQGTIIAAAQKREQDRAQELADTLKQIAELKRTVQTPQQVIREIPQFLPQLPQPIEPLPPNPGAAAAGDKKSAEPGAQDVRVPAADLKPLFDYVQDCRACQAKLASAQQDLKDEKAKNAALTTERDAAVKAAKGGGMWTRTERAVKWLAVGFAVGYAVHAKVH
jgi:peptidoglycan hydrolase CwlO-like protein